MSEILDVLDENARQKLEKTRQPKWTAPMLATLTHDHFSDPEWIYERKLDGERCLAFRDGKKVRLLSRNKKDLGETYPDVVEALEGQNCADFIVDGEIVAFDGNVTSFSRLQQRMKIKDADEARKSSVAVYLYLFDILYVEGHDCTKVGLLDRKRLLKEAISFSSTRLRFTPHQNEDGEAYLKEACRKGWEGLIAKKADSEYAHSRSKSWLKFKCSRRQEFVIGGFTEPKGERKGFGALVLGFYEDGELVCAGKVGTGFDDEMLVSLRKRMEKKERKISPFDSGEEPGGDVHWITPELVGEVAFTEWTNDLQLRHPRFMGLRRDKDPKDVVREEARAMS